MIFAKADLLGVSAFITALVGLMAWLVTQVGRVRTEHVARSALIAQGVSGKTAVEGFAVLTASQGDSIRLLQDQVKGLREEVDKCERQKTDLSNQFQKLAADLQKWFPNLPKPSTADPSSS